MPDNMVLGLEKLQRKLKQLEQPERVIQRGLQNYARSIQGEAESYAPESAANRSTGRYSWYVRGSGTETRTGIKYLNSQKMSNRWNNWPVKVLGRSVQLEIKNSADYSGYVIGDKQAWFHKRRGWKKTRDIIERTQGDAVRAIGKEIERELNK